MSSAASGEPATTAAQRWTDPEVFRRAATEWLDAHRGSAPRDYGPILPPELADEGRAWQRRLFDAGFAGLHWPVEYGGKGLTPEHHGIWVTECALARVPPILNMVGGVLTAGALLGFGTDDQRREHLRPIITGERIWCQLFSEPDAGSDLASLSTRAERDGDEFVLRGQKVWCSNGRVADMGIALARTDPTVPNHKGISFFLLDMHSPGVDIRPLRQMNGGSEFDEVHLDDVRVPATALLGEEGAGWQVAMGALTNERGYIGASSISLQRRLDAMLALAGSGTDGAGTGGAGTDGAGMSAVERDELVRLWSRGTSLWAMGRRQGPVASVLGSVAKLGTSELGFDVAMWRAGVAGPEAMLEGDTAEALLSAPGARIAGGTSQVQRNIIGERVLGLPKEPRPG
ncbi:MAG: acyl-CoA dehydrogenase family protein [Microthrixaceae bacterium]